MVNEARLVGCAGQGLSIGTARARNHEAILLHGGAAAEAGEERVGAEGGVEAVDRAGVLWPEDGVAAPWKPLAGNVDGRFAARRDALVVAEGRNVAAPASTERHARPAGDVLSEVEHPAALFRTPDANGQDVADNPRGREIGALKSAGRSSHFNGRSAIDKAGARQHETRIDDFAFAQVVPSKRGRHLSPRPVGD